jgi:hypothetical protein
MFDSLPPEFAVPVALAAAALWLYLEFRASTPDRPRR